MKLKQPQYKTPNKIVNTSSYQFVFTTWNSERVEVLSVFCSIYEDIRV
jgi:hypothetical protein